MRAHLTFPTDTLVSYHYYKRDEEMAPLTASKRLRLIGDSGAFSAYTQGSQIDIDDYAAWIKRWRTSLYWAASLDVFGNPEATLANFYHLRDHHGLDTVPTIHIGTDATWIDAYARQGVDFLGLGGMVKMPMPNILRWLVHVLRYARDTHPQMRFHAWGMSAQQILDKIPLYSVDSSGPLSYISRFALLFLYSERDRKVHHIDLKEGVPHRHRRLVRDEYGVSPDDLYPVTTDNRHLLNTLAVISAQRRTAALIARHNVTPPTWGMNPADTGHRGTRLHLVSATSDMRSLMGLAPHDVHTTP